VLKVVPGGGHTMFTWRALMPSLLEWMTPQLANNDRTLQARAQQARQAEQARLARQGRQEAAAKRKKAATPKATHKS
jgi:hypothetical protein